MPETVAVVIPEPSKGAHTSEHGLAKLFGYLGSAVAVVSLVGPDLINIFSKAHEAFPAVGWIASGAGAVASMLSVAMVLGKYIGGRNALKIAQIQAAGSAGTAAAGSVTDQATAAAILRGP